MGPLSRATVKRRRTGCQTGLLGRTLGTRCLAPAHRLARQRRHLIAGRRTCVKSERGHYRRAALVGAVAVGAGALAATLATNPVLAQVGRDPVLDGVVDLHVHSDPDVDPRSLDDVQVATKYAEAGARAILLKNTYVATSDRAYIARTAVPDIEVFGGIVLNKQVGGMNAAAIQAMAQMKGRYGKAVWLPTRDAQQQLDRFPRTDTPVAVVDAGGELLPAARECLSVIAGENLALFTGHVSAAGVADAAARGTRSRRAEDDGHPCAGGSGAFLD